MWAYTQANVTSRFRGSVQGTFGTDRPGFGTAVVTYHSPTEYGLVWGDINITMIYRYQEGRIRSFGLSGEPPKDRTGPAHTRTDLSFVKSFHLNNGVSPRSYFNVKNLYNQRDIDPRPDVDWWTNGLSLPRPDSAKYNNFGDTNELSRYTGFPREIEVGLMVSF